MAYLVLIGMLYNKNLVIMWISGKIYILVLPTENNSLFGDYASNANDCILGIYPIKKDLFGNYGCFMEKSAL